jgi:hypothetical protein
VLFVFAYGAGVVSLGLAVAVWAPRAGLALGIAVGAYVLMTIGPIVGLLMAGGREGGLMVGSTFFAVGSATHAVGHGNVTPDLWPAFVLSPLAYLLAAYLLYGATLRTFNHCLGRFDAEGALRRGRRSTRPLVAR